LQLKKCLFNNSTAMELKLDSDYRQRTVSSEVSGKISISYEVKQKTGSPVESMIGTITKNGSRIGSVAVDKNTNSLYLSIEKFDYFSQEERGLVFQTVNQNIDSLFEME